MLQHFKSIIQLWSSGIYLGNERMVQQWKSTNVVFCTGRNNQQDHTIISMTKSKNLNFFFRVSLLIFLKIIFSLFGGFLSKQEFSDPITFPWPISILLPITELTWIASCSTVKKVKDRNPLPFVVCWKLFSNSVKHYFVFVFYLCVCVCACCFKIK